LKCGIGSLGLGLQDGTRTLARRRRDCLCRQCGHLWLECIALRLRTVRTE